MSGSKRKYSKKYMDTIAEKKNGKCMSLLYEGVASEYEWECHRGHRWTATLGNIIYNKTWCRECHVSERYKYDYDKLLLIAEKKKSRLLSKVFLGVEEKHEWQCKKGHLTFETPRKFNLTGCKQCKRPKKLKIEEVRKRAAEINFTLVDDYFKDVTHSHRWQCNVCKNIKRISYKSLYYTQKCCLECKRVETLKQKEKEVMKMAEKKGYKIIEFKSGYPSFDCILQCDKGHLRNGNLRMLRTKSKCGECVNTKKLKYTLDDAIKIAEKKDGVVFSEKFEANGVEWGCKQGHKWTASFYNVKNGTWCPECAKVNGKRGRPKKMIS